MVSSAALRLGETFTRLKGVSPVAEPGQPSPQAESEQPKPQTDSRIPEGVPQIVHQLYIKAADLTYRAGFPSMSKSYDEYEIAVIKKLIPGVLTLKLMKNLTYSGEDEKTRIKERIVQSTVTAAIKLSEQHAIKPNANIVPFNEETILDRIINAVNLASIVMPKESMSEKTDQKLEFLVIWQDIMAQKAQEAQPAEAQTQTA